MRIQRMTFADLVVVLAAVAAIPAEVVLVREGVQELAVFTAVVIGAGLVALVTGWQPYAVPRLEMVDAVAAPAQPSTLRVVGARGTCPLGFRPGSTWAIDGSGRLSSSLCRPAIDALGAVLQGVAGRGEASVASCRCPLVSPPVSLSFAVQPQA